MKLRQAFDAFLDMAIKFLCISAACGLVWLAVEWMMGK